MQAIFRALDEVKNQDWFASTIVYLYRGAWQVGHLPASCMTVLANGSRSIFSSWRLSNNLHGAS